MENKTKSGLQSEDDLRRRLNTVYEELRDLSRREGQYEREIIERDYPHLRSLTTPDGDWAARAAAVNHAQSVASATYGHQYNPLVKEAYEIGRKLGIDKYEIQECIRRRLS